MLIASIHGFQWLVSTTDMEVVIVFVVLVAFFMGLHKLIIWVKEQDRSKLLFDDDEIPEVGNYTFNFQNEFIETKKKGRSIIVKVIAVIWAVLIAGTPLCEFIPQLKSESFYNYMCCICW